MKRPEQTEPVGVNIEVGYVIPLEEAGADLDARSLLSAIVRYKRLVLLGLLLGLAASVAAIFLVTPIYRAELLMASNLDETSNVSSLAGNYGNLASLAGIDLTAAGDETEEALALLRSRRFTTAFIAENNLLPVLFETEFAKANIANDKELPTMWAAHERFEEEVRFLARDADTGLIQLAIDWKDPEEAARWANLLVERANQFIRQAVIEEAQRSLDYLNTELKSTSNVELHRALYRLIESQIERIMVANVRAEYAFKIIDPATPPDPDEYRFPNEPLFVVIGIIGGLTVGVGTAILLWMFRSRRKVVTDAEQ